MENTRNVDRLVLAVVDIGTNTLKFTVASCDRDDTIAPITERAETVRIGAGIEATGKISEDRAARAIAALREFDRIAEAAGAISLTGVATETLRLATNGHDFLARIATETRWQIRVISGEEEARLTFVGLRPRLPTNGTSCIADIGGGSTEWIDVEHAEIVASHSLPLGSGRLADRFFQTDPPGMDALSNAQRAATDVLAAHHIRAPEFVDTLLLSGGNGQFLEQLRAHLKFGPGLNAATIASVLGYLATAPAIEVAEILNIAEERARVLPAGVAIAAAVVDRCHPASIVAVPSGIRTGLLMERAQALFG